jgi:hypothetical protein
MSDEKKISKEEKKGKVAAEAEEKKVEEEKKIDWDAASKNSLVAKTIGSRAAFAFRSNCVHNRAVSLFCRGRVMQCSLIGFSCSISLLRTY